MEAGDRSFWHWPADAIELLKVIIPMVSTIATIYIAFYLNRIGDRRRRQDVSLKMFERWNTREMVEYRSEIVNWLSSNYSWQESGGTEEKKKIVFVLTFIIDIVRLIESKPGRSGLSRLIYGPGPTPSADIVLLRNLIPEAADISGRLFQPCNWLSVEANKRYRDAVRLNVLLREQQFSRLNALDVMLGYRKPETKTDTFDPDFYLNEYPDVRSSNFSATDHYRIYGDVENRRPYQGFVEPPLFTRHATLPAKKKD